MIDDLCIDDEDRALNPIPQAKPALILIDLNSVGSYAFGRIKS